MDDDIRPAGRPSRPSRHIHDDEAVADAAGTPNPDGPTAPPPERDAIAEKLQQATEGVRTVKGLAGSAGMGPQGGMPAPGVTGPPSGPPTPPATPTPAAPANVGQPSPAAKPPTPPSGPSAAPQTPATSRPGPPDRVRVTAEDTVDASTTFDPQQMRHDAAVSDSTSPRMGDFHSANQDATDQRIDAGVDAGVETLATWASGGTDAKAGELGNTAKRATAKAVSTGVKKLRHTGKAAGEAVKQARRRTMRTVAAVMVGVLALLVMPFLGGGAPAFADQPEYRWEGTDNEDLEVPPAVRSVYYETGVRHDVPWTVLAAIGKHQTDHGRRSPYDDCDRDPFRENGGQSPTGEPAVCADDVLATSYPVTSPPIGQADSDEGLGLFLLAPEFGATIDGGGQDVDDAVDALGEELARIRDELDDEIRRLPSGGGGEGDDVAALPPPRDDDPQAFWAAVVDRSPVVARGEAPLSCSNAAADTSSVGSAAASVQIIWQCVLARAGDALEVAVPGPLVDGEATWTVLSGNGARTRLISEAIAVVNAWWEITGGACDNSEAGPAGVLPLEPTVEVDRCDASAAIAEAAAVVAERAAVPIADRPADPPYAPVTYEWQAMPWVLGDAATATRFQLVGPPAEFPPNQPCETVARDAADVIARNSDIDWAAVSAGLDDDALNDAMEALDSIALAPACSTALRETVDADVDVLDDPAEGDVDEDSEAGLSGVDQAARNAERIRRVRAWVSDDLRVAGHEHIDESEVVDDVETVGSEEIAARNIALSEWLEDRTQPPMLVVGVDAPVARARPEARTYDVPPVPFVSLPTASNGLGELIIDVANGLGGLFAGDPLAGNSQTFGGATSVKIAVGRQRFGNELLVNNNTARNALPTTEPCGASGAFPFQQFMIDAYMRACRDAELAGQQFIINSATRTSVEQAALFAKYGPGRAARPGTSNHERGVAVDMGIVGDQNKSWMHAIVGCVEPESETYRPFTEPISHLTYQPSDCDGLQPVKRGNLYGLWPLCGYADPATAIAVVRCVGHEGTKKRENWHWEPGVLITISAGAVDLSDCENAVTSIDAQSQTAVAVAVWQMFYCQAAANGIANEPPTPRAGGTFANKAEQIAAEAVIVGWCESVGFDPTNLTGRRPDGTWKGDNGFDANSNVERNEGMHTTVEGYAGLFQMGPDEARNYIPGWFNPGDQPENDLRFDVVANATGAARYFLAGYGRNKWDGWGPWAVINTDYGGPNEGVKYPVVPRFPSTRNGYAPAHNPQSQLPEFATSPSTGPIPTQPGCPLFTGVGFTFPAAGAPA